jgi:hypothetical protein
MDTSPGTSFYYVLVSYEPFYFLDVSIKKTVSNGARPSTVCLPYSSVPGMDYSSRVYAKAISTLSKQIHSDNPPVKLDGTVAANISKVSGAFYYLLLSLLFLIPFSFGFSDKTNVIVSKFDQDNIQRARNTVSNEVIVEIVNEEPSFDISFQNSIRQQIIDNCARLRVSLLSIDHLMDQFNRSTAKSTSSA